MKHSKTPGTYKDSASFEEKTLKLPEVRGRIMQEQSTKDEDYSYTEDRFPGFMHEDPNLSRAERMHKRTKQMEEETIEITKEQLRDILITWIHSNDEMFTITLEKFCDMVFEFGKPWDNPYHETPG